MVGREEELYHVVHDPAELNDVADHQEYGSVKNELKERLFRWMEETDDHVLQGIVPNRPEEPGWGPWENLK
jgi:hypothetical protein